MANGVASAASGYALGGGGGSANAAAFAASNITVLAQEMLGGNGGVNYILKSDKLNLAAVISASKTDNRAKYLASPIVMTVDNKEAIVEATSSKQFLTGWSAQSSSVNGGGMPSPNYSAKDIGIKLKMTPKINPNGTVMLTVEEEYSQVSDKQDMLTPVGATYRTDTVEVPVTRKMTSDIRLENMQTVVLGGLVENYKSNYETGIPLLKDIPWVGRWLFGHVEDHEDRKELLVFLTPYVLDDEESAQYEAFRRKKALSDSRPWEDHGWSASELADPVSKKEKLRRFKDEWARQDEERKTKLAIEKAKIDRAKALEQMDEKERKFWLELHKDELDKEQKEEFEKQMEEQKDLQELAASIRAKKLEKADEKLKAEDAATKGETERERLNKEKEAAAHPEPAPSPTQSESSPGRAGSPLPAAETNIAPSAASNPDSGLLGDLAPAKGN